MSIVRRAAPSPASFWWWMLGVWLVGLAIRLTFVVVAAGDRPIFGDALAYYLYGQSIGDGNGMVTVAHEVLGTDVVDPVPTAQLPPLYSYFLGFLDVLGISGVFNQKLVTAALGSLTPVLLGGAGREIGGERLGPATGVLAGGLAAVYPLLWVVDGSLMSETLFGVLLAAMLWVAMYARHHPSAPWFAVGGVLLGLAALARGEILLAGGAMFAIIGVATGGTWLRRGVLVGAAAATCVAVLTPWTVRNLIEFEEPVLIATNSNAVFAGANCAEVYDGLLLGLWFYDCYGPPPPGDESQQALEYRRRGLTYASDNLDRLPTVVAARLGRVWGVFRVSDQANYDAYEGRVREVTIAGFVMYYPLAVAAIGGAVLLWRRDRVATAALLTLPASATLIAMLVYGSTRFRFAAEPALVLLGAVGITTAASWAVDRRRRRGADPTNRPRVAPGPGPEQPIGH